MATTSEIRSWAKEFGLAVGVRGRLPPEVIAAYERVHDVTARGEMSKTTLPMSHDEIINEIEAVTQARLGMSSVDAIKAYRNGKLDDPGKIGDAIILADLLDDDDPVTVEEVQQGRKRQRRYMTGFCQYPGENNGHRHCRGGVTNGNGERIKCICICHE